MKNNNLWLLWDTTKYVGQWLLIIAGSIIFWGTMIGLLLSVIKLVVSITTGWCL